MYPLNYVTFVRNYPLLRLLSKSLNLFLVVLYKVLDSKFPIHPPQTNYFFPFRKVVSLVVAYSSLDPSYYTEISFSLRLTDPIIHPLSLSTPIPFFGFTNSYSFT